MTDIPRATTTQPARSSFGIGSIVLIIGVLMVIIVFGLQLASQGLSQPTSGPAPLFEMTTYNGGAFRLADMRGKVVVLNFWASWCGPCRDEAPDLQNISITYRDRGVEVVGVTYLDTEDDARAFMAEFGMTYTNGLDGASRISDLYHIEGVPETFVIDQQGSIVYFFSGPIDPQQLIEQLDRLTGGAS